MYRVWYSIALVAAVLVLGGCKPSRTPAAAPVPSEIDPTYGHLVHAQPKLPTIKVWLGSEELSAEIATRPVEVATGMMFRTNMLENEAMLFVFSDAAPRSFYMRNCFVPLSAAYLSPSGEILQLIDMQPHNEKGIPSVADNIQFVLEVPQGWFARHNIKPGAVARTDRGSLMETFYGRN